MPDFQSVSAIFLQTELNTGLTFAGIALTPALGAEKVARNRANARAAYDSLLRFKDSVALTPEQSAVFDLGFARLRDQLRELGEVL